jgi:tetratricopeptide (TPR) repeat protein
MVHPTRSGTRFGIVPSDELRKPKVSIALAQRWFLAHRTLALRRLTGLLTCLLVVMQFGLFLAVAPVFAQGAGTTPNTATKPAPNTTLRDDPDPVSLALTRTRELRAKGEFNEATRLLESALSNHPRDLQLRFMKGLLLTDQKLNDQAIAVFESLSQDFPELGEPHNNLAVLLAGKGELEKARYALERAIQAQPDYGLAYENLGDIYLRLAERAYGDANQKNPNSKSAKAKLDQAKEWVKVTEK